MIAFQKACLAHLTDHVEGLEALDEPQQYTVVGIPALKRENGGNAWHCFIQKAEQLNLGNRERRDSLTVLPGQKAKILILLILRSVRNQRIRFLKCILGDPERITFVRFRLTELSITILLHLVWIDQIDWKIRILKSFQEGIVIVTGWLHKDGRRFRSLFDVIDQCQQFISDMVDIKRFSSDAAITIEDGHRALGF